MEDNKRLIEAVVIKTGEKVRVRQAEAGSEYFVTEDNSPYKSEELDFTQRDELLEWLLKPKDDYFKERQDFMTKMMNNLDPIALEERRAKEAEKEYWRNLRGQVFIEMMKSVIHPVALEETDKIIETLYSQDVKFNEKKKCN